LEKNGNESFVVEKMNSEEQCYQFFVGNGSEMKVNKLYLTADEKIIVKNKRQN